jgi:NhaP-type Na+/H+ or K+/H+ antiporter
MKAFLAIILGLALLLAPLWTLSGFVTVPEYRSGTIADYSSALIAGATLYGGVLVGVLVSRTHKSQWNGPVPFRTTFMAGMAGAMGAITLALLAGFLNDLISTGRLMPEGQSPALLPVFYIVGGILSAFMAAGVGLIAYGLSGAAQGEKPE